MQSAVRVRVEPGNKLRSTNRTAAPKGREGLISVLREQVRKADTRSSAGRTVTNPSSFPAKWARTLDHAQSAAYPTKPARTGLRLI